MRKQATRNLILLAAIPARSYRFSVINLSALTLAIATFPKYLAAIDCTVTASMEG